MPFRSVVGSTTRELPCRNLEAPPFLPELTSINRHDTELTDLIPFLADLATVEDVRSVLDANLYLPNAVGPEGAEGTTAAGETDGITSALQQL